jgi:hypothetical protein
MYGKSEIPKRVRETVEICDADADTGPSTWTGERQGDKYIFQNHADASFFAADENRVYTKQDDRGMYIPD